MWKRGLSGRVKQRKWRRRIAGVLAITIAGCISMLVMWIYIRGQMLETTVINGEVRPTSHNVLAELDGFTLVVSALASLVMTSVLGLWLFRPIDGYLKFDLHWTLRKHKRHALHPLARPVPVSARVNIVRLPGRRPHIDSPVSQLVGNDSQLQEAQS